MDKRFQLSKLIVAELLVHRHSNNHAYVLNEIKNVVKTGNKNGNLIDELSQLLLKENQAVSYYSGVADVHDANISQFIEYNEGNLDEKSWAFEKCLFVSIPDMVNQMSVNKNKFDEYSAVIDVELCSSNDNNKIISNVGHRHGLKCNLVHHHKNIAYIQIVYEKHD